jgi:hypothetical protein
MLLGEIMSELKDETTAASALASLGDLILIAQVDEARGIHDETPGEYASGAAQRFARMASDEDWQQLMTFLEKSETPAVTCLTTMLRWSVKQDMAHRDHGAHHAHHHAEGGCGCGGGGGCHG